MEKVERTDAEWREQLSPQEYDVLRKAGTERAFTGEYTDTETTGVYKCRACGAELFRSDTKFHSGCGWPSFYQPVEGDAVTLIEDRSGPSGPRRGARGATPTSGTSSPARGSGRRPTSAGALTRSRCRSSPRKPRNSFSSRLIA
jgi:hypothetical protein